MNQEQIRYFALTLASSYIDTLCRICNKPILESDIETAIWFGYAKGNNRDCLAHKECWDKQEETKRDLV